MNKFKRTTLLLVVSLTCLLVAGCDASRGQVPLEIRNAKKPLTLISKGGEGVIIEDAEGEIYAYDETYYFAQNIIAGSFKVGDKLSGN